MKAGGGGIPDDQNSQTPLLNALIPDDVTPPSTAGPEYQIIGISVTYKPASIPKEPQKAKKIFSGWKIDSVYTSLNNSGLKTGSIMNHLTASARLRGEVSCRR
jgi:hypothetical protein